MPKLSLAVHKKISGEQYRVFYAHGDSKELKKLTRSVRQSTYADFAISEGAVTYSTKRTVPNGAKTGVMLGFTDDEDAVAFRLSLPDEVEVTECDSWPSNYKFSIYSVVE